MWSTAGPWAWWACGAAWVLKLALIGSLLSDYDREDCKPESDQGSLETLAVIEGGRTHVFLSPEDTWTWLHAKESTQAIAEEAGTGDRLVPKFRRQKHRPIITRPPCDLVVVEHACTVPKLPNTV
ncbi:hypothetical protein NDU88_002342 [Pleurodeles waltl]|uniref:Secreted protein n=1 Tax=Pleurodeles waltl TaxID=8319 RepID=A0AAV7UWR5_PLEWA|nr:hypothetical protein NDU88_002342 [Pleurodeles waltl]